MFLIETAVGFLLGITQSVCGSVLAYCFPQVLTMEEHIRDNWRRYVMFILYTVAVMSIFTLVFLASLVVAFILHGKISAGLNIHYVDIDFNMEMIPGAQWGKSHHLRNEDDDDFISKEEASSFQSRWTTKDRRTRNTVYEEVSGTYCETTNEEASNMIKKQNERIAELRKELQSQQSLQRCVQRANPGLALIPNYDYTVSMVITTPETHHDRLKANTPLWTKIGSETVTKPIPTPSRSYLLSTFRTLFFSPLLVIGAMPETNEIEISIWGGANRPFNSPNQTETIEFVIESCDLQVLNAKIVVAPSITSIQLFISRFRLTSIFLIAVVLDTFAVMATCLMLLAYFYISGYGNEQLVLANKDDSSVEDLKSTGEDSETESRRQRKISKSRKRSRDDNPDDHVTDSWSEVNDSD